MNHWQWAESLEILGMLKGAVGGLCRTGRESEAKLPAGL